MPDVRLRTVAAGVRRVLKPKLVFVIMSAVHPVQVVRELVRSLAPHTVLVHHDFSQTPDFELSEPNVIFVPHPKKTGWGAWGFTEGIFHSIRYALDSLEFDYLQLLSPTCLPIKPLSSFEEHVAARTSDVNFSWVDLYDDTDGLMSVGYRMFAPEHSMRHRFLRRVLMSYYGTSDRRRDVAGVQLRTSPAMGTDGSLPWRARLALKMIQGWARPGSGRHPFDENFRPCFGSAWFGARRHVLEWMVRRFSQPDIVRYFSRLRIPEELVIPTLLRNSGFKSGPYNHCIITFNGPNPKWLDEGDFGTLQASPAFFARKFPVELDAPIRRRVLLDLVHRGKGAGAAGSDVSVADAWEGKAPVYR